MSLAGGQRATLSVRRQHLRKRKEKSCELFRAGISVCSAQIGLFGSRPAIRSRFMDEVHHRKCTERLRLTTHRDTSWELLNSPSHHWSGGEERRSPTRMHACASRAPAAPKTPARRFDRRSKAPRLCLLPLRMSGRVSDAATHTDRNRAHSHTETAHTLRTLRPFTTALYKTSAVSVEKISSRLRVSRILLPMSHRKVST